MILAGDVGGTKVDLALCKFDRGQLLTVHEHKFSAKEFSGLEQVVDAFLEAANSPSVSLVTCWRPALACPARCATAA